MEINYQILYQDHVIESHIPALSTKVKSLIKNAIEERLMVDPIAFGKPLRYSLKTPVEDKLCLSSTDKTLKKSSLERSYA